jgi:hypothetical protein
MISVRSNRGLTHWLAKGVADASAEPSRLGLGVRYCVNRRRDRSGRAIGGRATVREGEDNTWL